MPEDQPQSFLLRGRRAQDPKRAGGTVLLAGPGKPEHIQHRRGRSQRIDGRPELFAAQMIQMAFQLADLFPAAAALRVRRAVARHFPDAQPGRGRTRTVAGAQPSQPPQRPVSKTVRQRMHQRRAGRRHQLGLRVARTHRLALHEPGRGRSGQGDAPVRALDAAAEPRQGRGRHPIHAQLFQPPADAEDVHQRVHGPDLMEMHLLRRDAVRVRLGPRQAVQHGQSSRTHALRHVRPAEDGGDVRRMAQGLLLLPPAHVHAKARPARAVLLPAFDDAGHAVPLQTGRKRSEVHAQMGQRRQRHVAADAVCAIPVHFHVPTS